MPYCLNGDVENQAGGNDRMVQLTDWDKNGTVDVARVDAAIATADAEIDSHACHRYRVPFNPVPAVIKEKSAELAFLILRRRRGANMWGQEEQLRWDAIVGKDGWLQLLREGKVTVGTVPGALKNDEMVVDTAVATLSESRDVSRDKLGGAAW